LTRLGVDQLSCDIVLASSSTGRRTLLKRLQIPFSAISPDIDESAHAGEQAPQLAERLAREKAEAIAGRRPDSIIIGADQVADLHGRIIGKPGSVEAARAQLREQSGQTVYFHTGLAVIAPAFKAPRTILETVETTFRELTEAQIEACIQADDPLQTAGTLKSESLGIALVKRIRSNDPSTLIGLPLIALTDLLAEAGINLPPAAR
jgi:septum formation protein